MKIGIPAGRVLNFDIEMRPLGWFGGDWVHAEPTVIACGWQGDPDSIEAYWLTKRATSAKTMLRKFRKRYDEATVVVGHYIRGFDLSRLNAAYLENGMPGLGDKYTHDTKGDLTKIGGLSKSQQNLGSWLGIEAPKIGMSMEDWRRANRLDPEGIKFAVDRAIGDVQQNMEMHTELRSRGMLTAPKLWTAGDAIDAPSYRP